MMKYRILKKESSDDTWYEVQYKWLCFWFNVTVEYDTDTAKKFYSKELAEKYIRQQEPIKTTIL